MIKPFLFEGCSVAIALVLVVADCRHITAERAEGISSISSQMASARHQLEIDLQGRNDVAGTAGYDGNVVKQLSSLSTLMTARVSHLAAAGADPAY